MCKKPSPEFIEGRNQTTSSPVGDQSGSESEKSKGSESFGSSRPSTLKQAISLFRAKDYDVKSKAYDSFKKIMVESPEEITEDLVQKIISSFDDEDLNTRRFNIMAFWRIVTLILEKQNFEIIIKESFKKLISQLKYASKKDYKSIVYITLDTLCEIIKLYPEKIDKKFVDTLTPLFEDSYHRDIRTRALLVFWEIASCRPDLIREKHTKKIFSLLSDEKEDEGVRTFAFSGFGAILEKQSINKQRKILTQPRIEKIMSLFEDNSDRIRRNVVRFFARYIAEIKPEFVTRKNIDKVVSLFNDKDQWVRLTAKNALGLLFDKVDKEKSLFIDIFKGMGSISDSEKEAIEEILKDLRLKAKKRQEKIAALNKDLEDTKLFPDIKRRLTKKVNELKKQIKRNNRALAYILYLNMMAGKYHFKRNVIAFGATTQKSVDKILAITDLFENLKANERNPYYMLTKFITAVDFIPNKKKRNSIYGEHFKALLELAETAKFISEFPSEESILKDLLGKRKWGILTLQKELVEIKYKVIEDIIGAKLDRSKSLDLSQEVLNSLKYQIERKNAQLKRLLRIYIVEGKKETQEYIKSLPGNDKWKNDINWLKGPGCLSYNVTVKSDIKSVVERERRLIFDEISEHIRELEGILGIRISYELTGDILKDIESIGSVLKSLKNQEKVIQQKEAPRIIDDINSHIQDIKSKDKTIFLQESQEITIAVEQDPIEALHLGVGFGSCLDITGGSYREFALTNALDLNKRVIFARDSAKHRIARVLTAVTDEGIVCFRFYNTSNLDLDEAWIDYLTKYAILKNTPLIIPFEFVSIEMLKIIKARGDFQLVSGIKAKLDKAVCDNLWYNDLRGGLLHQEFITEQGMTLNIAQAYIFAAKVRGGFISGDRKRSPSVANSTTSSPLVSLGMAAPTFKRRCSLPLEAVLYRTYIGRGRPFSSLPLSSR